VSSAELADARAADNDYADEIFSLGRDLMDTVQGRPTGRPLRLNVGVADVLPKLVAYRLLQPALGLPEQVHIVCHEGGPAELLPRLAIYELDLVWPDSPIGPDVKVRAFNHLLGECGVSIFGTRKLATKHQRGFTKSLDGAPFIIPMTSTALWWALEHWFDAKDVRPSVCGEFDDSALLKVFGQGGAGLFAAPTVIEKEVQRQYSVKVVGRLESVRERFYAISVEKKVQHPAVLAIAEEARQELFR